ncbi:MAG TPA: hypothetical protein VM328_05030 [Fimbriimonadaceae bacterium]|nr:hypothetical protein [Fimbriimonadaceae bacterium]HVM34269.1 hypothetical protein [Actinomycetota bacterium]
MTTHTIDQLRHAGLLHGAEPHLTDKGHAWLRTLESVRSKNAAPHPANDEFIYLPDTEASTASSGTLGDDEDFVSSCSGLLR